MVTDLTREMRCMHLRSKMTRFNEDLDIVESEIIRHMRLGLPTAEMIHCLIGERENIKYKLKELHKKVYV
jgi:hypothetical protein